MKKSRPQVVIVGAGPTGLTLALLLARSGIRSVLIERNAEPQPHPAACILDTRTMEIFREIGLAETILERCQNVFERARITWVTSLAGRELGHCSALPDDVAAVLALSPVHATQFPQNRLEPTLWQRVRDNPLITFLPGAECVGIAADADGVTCTTAGSAEGASSVSGEYLVACDGVASPVRRLVGIPTEGSVLQHMIGVYFTADLSAFVDHRKSILYWTMNPTALGVLIAHWLPSEWVLFVPYYPPQQSPAEFSEARCRAFVDAAIGAPVPDLSIKLVRPWVLSATLAARYRQGRVFLAGDAAHGFPPTGGLGLNTGVQDVHNLAWKLAAVITGKAGPRLLETYEQERRPVARTNLDHSRRNYDNMGDLLRVVGLDLRHQRHLRAVQNAWLFRSLPAAWQKRAVDGLLRRAERRLAILAAETDRGSRARCAFERRIPGQVRHYRFIGLDLGFTYERGAFIPEPSAKPAVGDPVVDYRPMTWPSARLPHFWVERQGTRLSIHDALSRDGFTLLTHAAGNRAWREAVAAAVADLSLPLRCLGIGPEEDADLVDTPGAWTTLSEIEPTGAVLVRPDGHVGWRTKSLPGDPARQLADVMARLLCLHQSATTNGAEQRKS